MQAAGGYAIITHSPPLRRNIDAVKARLLVPAAIVVLVLLASLIYVLTLSITVRGVVSDALTGEPLGGVAVRSGAASAQSDAQGRYSLSNVARSAGVTLTLDGFQPGNGVAHTGSLLDRSTTLDVALQPVVLEGIVSDAVSAQPLANAVVALGGDRRVTAADGTYRFVRVKQDAVIQVSADGYDARSLGFGGETVLPVALEPNTVTVAAVDGDDNSPIGHAVLSNDGHALQPSGDRFVLRGVKQQTQLTAQADGYLPATLRYTGGPAITITLTANSVAGLVRDQASGQPLAGITITLQQAAATRTTSSAAGGVFQMRQVRSGALLTASSPDHETAVITYTGQPTLAFILRPDALRGVVRDLYSGQPMAGVTITVQQSALANQAGSDSAGVFRLAHVPLGALVSATAAAHASASITYTGQVSVELALRPNTLRGVVRDAAGQPIAGAAVSAGSVKTTTTANGAYTLAGIAEGASLIVDAAGHDRASVTIGQLTTLDVRLGSLTARGIFIPFYLLTVPERVRSLIDFAGRSGMTAIVVDIKGDDGYIAYASDTPLAKEIKPQYRGSMIGLDEVLSLAKQRGMYTIARMVVFKDNLLVDARPDLSVTDSRTGKAWDDCGNGSTLWADPFRKEVVDYNAGIAEEAARMGFDEVQFDYIRFPPACIQGAGLAYAHYAVTSTMETRIAAIDTFLAEARRRVRPLGVALAVDTFGWTMFRDDDLMIGQRIEDMAKHVDYICPMVYPSTWEFGALGLDYVPSHPYEVVYQSIKFAMNRLKATPGVKIRPWLQDFDDYQSRELAYGVRELDLQRRGAADAGAEGWLLWNAGGVYTEETAP